MANEALVVRREELAEALGRALRKAGSIGALAQLLEMDATILRRILTEDKQSPNYVGLFRADEMLQRAGEEGALHAGRVHILPNPHWTKQHWRKRMRESGVTRPREVLS